MRDSRNIVFVTPTDASSREVEKERSGVPTTVQAQN